MKTIYYLLILYVLMIMSCNDGMIQNTTYGIITGKIYNETNNQILYGATITTIPETQSVQSDDKGNYIIEGLTAGKYIIKANKEGYNEKSVEINVLEGYNTICDLYLKPKPSINDNLLAYWSFDDGTATDYSGNNYHGELKNKPQIIDGVHGKAFRFFGVGATGSNGSHIIIPDLKLNLLNEFTICLWVKEEYWSHEQGGAYISFGDWNYGEIAIRNQYPFGTNGPRVYQFSVGSLHNDITSPYEIIDPLYVTFDTKDINKWVFLTLVYNDGRILAYKNGLLIGLLIQRVRVHGKNAGISRSWWEDGYNTETRFIGSVDEVRIYKRALTDEEIKYLGTL